jgi:hypothetical protein
MNIIFLGSVCKARWNNIRDNYRKSLIKRGRKSGQAATKRRKYKYEDQLSFLSGYFQEKGMIGNFSVEDTQEGEVYEQGEGEEGHFEESNKESAADNQSSKGHSALQQPAVRCLPSSSAPAKNRKCEPQETAALTLKEYLLNKNEAKPATPVQVDVVDAFLAGLAPTLKTFTPYYLNLAKTKIFSAVQEYELAMIMEKKRQPATPRGYGWEQGISCCSDKSSPSTTSQSTALPSSHCTPIISEHITQLETVSTGASELVIESDNQPAAERFHKFSTK